MLQNGLSFRFKMFHYTRLYSSVVMEPYKALNYSQVHHFFGSPGNMSSVVFTICSTLLCLHVSGSVTLFLMLHVPVILDNARLVSGSDTKNRMLVRFSWVWPNLNL